MCCSLVASESASSGWNWHPHEGLYYISDKRRAISFAFAYAHVGVVYTYRYVHDYEYKYQHRQAVNTPFVWRVSVLNLRGTGLEPTDRSLFAKQIHRYADTQIHTHTQKRTHCTLTWGVIKTTSIQSFFSLGVLCFCSFSCWLCHSHL